MRCPGSPVQRSPANVKSARSHLPSLRSKEECQFAESPLRGGKRRLVVRRNGNSDAAGWNSGRNVAPQKLVARPSSLGARRSARRRRCPTRFSLVKNSRLSFFAFSFSDPRKIVLADARDRQGYTILYSIHDRYYRQHSSSEQSIRSRTVRGSGTRHRGRSTETGWFDAGMELRRS